MTKTSGKTFGGGFGKMHLSDPRLKPLTDEQLDDDTRRILDRARMGGQVFNVFRTLAHYPNLLERWMVFGTHVVLNKSSLPPRERELVILRIGWLCRSEYEWGQI
jgi:4-carboxymuconolactone decarboxylase